MTETAQKRKLRKYRRRLAKRGTARFAAPSEPPNKGGILTALRCSPLVGTYFNLVRSRGTGRIIHL